MKVPILMYHKVSKVSVDKLTVNIDQLEDQIRYILKKGYTPCFFSEINSECFKKIRKPILITFDDGYVNNFELMYPIIRKYNVKVTIFIPFLHVGKTDVWNSIEEDLMSVKTINSFDRNIVEIGIHSYKHDNLKSMSIDEIKKDTSLAISEAESLGIKLTKVYAYPYGGIPKNLDVKNEMKKIFKNLGIKYALRIGNRINRFPFKDNFELQRLDIQGTNSMLKFRMQLAFGKFIF